MLYLDEPTSGLDAYNSLAVMRLLNELCKLGKTVSDRARVFAESDV